MTCVTFRVSLENEFSDYYFELKLLLTYIKLIYILNIYIFYILKDMTGSKSYNLTINFLK